MTLGSKTRLRKRTKQAVWRLIGSFHRRTENPNTVNPCCENNMDQATHNKIVSFIWGIADDVLRDLFKRGKYPDVILPMCVLRRLDAVLEPTKKAVLDIKKKCWIKHELPNSAPHFCDAAGQAFYNVKFTLRDLRSRGSQQQLRG